MVTKQAENENLHRANTVVEGEGRIKVVGSTPLDDVDLSPLDTTRSELSVLQKGITRSKMEGTVPFCPHWTPIRLTKGRY